MSLRISWLRDEGGKELGRDREQDKCFQVGDSGRPEQWAQESFLGEGRPSSAREDLMKWKDVKGISSDKLLQCSRETLNGLAGECM